jgi:hypothetical protein
MHILDNNIIHWEKIGASLNDFAPEVPLTYLELLKLDFFRDWLVGFTSAEGSFGMKANNDAFYSIRQTGLFNLPIIQAIQFCILGELRSTIKPDSANSYKIAMQSIKDLQLVINFFSFPGVIPLVGHKAAQYNLWIGKLKASKRYRGLNFPPV